MDHEICPKFGNLTASIASISFPDRTQPTVNVWTAFGNSQVVIREQARTVQASNSMSSLRINVDFSQPITDTAAELQSLLNITNGILTPTQRRSHGNRRFGFLVCILGKKSSPIDPYWRLLKFSLMLIVTLNVVFNVTNSYRLAHYYTKLCI